MNPSEFKKTVTTGIPNSPPKICACSEFLMNLDKAKGHYALKVVFSIGKFVVYKKGPTSFQCSNCGGYR